MIKHLIPALLLSPLAFAETAPAPESAATPTVISTTTPVYAAAPVERTRANHLSVGPSFTRMDYRLTVNDARDTRNNPRNFFGPEFTYGRYIGESSVGFHEVGARLAIRMGSVDNGPTSTAVVEVPFLAQYNYNFRLGDTTRLYLGPRLGFSGMGLGVADDATDFFDVDSDTSAKFGAGIGLKQQFTKLFGMSFGYEYLRGTSTRFSLRDNGVSVTARITNPESHTLAISATWTF